MAVGPEVGANHCRMALGCSEGCQSGSWAFHPPEVGADRCRMALGGSEEWHGWGAFHPLEVGGDCCRVDLGCLLVSSTDGLLVVKRFQVIIGLTESDGVG